MNHCAIQQNDVVRSREELQGSITVPSSMISPDRNNHHQHHLRTDAVVCPKPRRVSILNGTFNDPSRPLRWQLSHQAELSDSKPGSELLDIILRKGGGEAAGMERSGTNNSNSNIAQVVASSSPPFFSGSPPSRVSNPLIQDARFREEMVFLSSSNTPPGTANTAAATATTTMPWSSTTSSPSGARKGGCVRANFGNNPAVRIEGFDCLDRDRNRNCSIPALA